MRLMTRVTGRFLRHLLTPAIAVVVAMGGIALASPANATGPDQGTPAIVVGEQNFDLSETDQSQQLQRKRGGHGEVCEGDKCGPITWCEDKPGGHNGPGKPVEALPVGKQAIIGNEPEDGDNGDGPKGGGDDKPRCYHKPAGQVDADNCCENPPGGTVYVKFFSKNKTAVPGQITVTPKGGKAYTVNIWIKPGKSKVKIKGLPNGWFIVRAHLFDCTFVVKVVKINCERVRPTPTTTEPTTPEPTPTATATTEPTPEPTDTTTTEPTPTATADAPGSGGGDNSGGGGELALTGSGSAIWWSGGGLVAVGVLAIFLLAVYNRRRRTPRFVAGE